MFDMGKVSLVEIDETELALNPVAKELVDRFETSGRLTLEPNETGVGVAGWICAGVVKWPKPRHPERSLGQGGV